MVILITGSGGLVGRYLFKDLRKHNEVYGVSRRKSLTTTYRADITKPEIIEILNSVSPDVIIHSAALTAVDYCEDHVQKAMKTNVEGTRSLVDWANRNGARFVYISTDYVYPGETNNYDENSETKPLQVYGRTKLEGEDLVRKLEDYAILRPTVIFGNDPCGKNFLMQMLSLKEKRKIPIDQVSNPTDVNVLVDYIRGVLKQDLVGTFVATGPETMGRMEFACVISEVFSLDKTLLEGVSTDSLQQKALRPLNNGTNSSRIREALRYDSPSVRESLTRIKSTI